jgi:hypothetical protein
MNLEFLEEAPGMRSMDKCGTPSSGYPGSKLLTDGPMADGPPIDAGLSSGKDRGAVLRGGAVKQLETLGKAGPGEVGMGEGVVSRPRFRPQLVAQETSIT